MLLFLISSYFRFCLGLLISQVSERGNPNGFEPLFIDLAVVLLISLHWLFIFLRKNVCVLFLFFEVTHIHSLPTTPDSTWVTQPTNSPTLASASVHIRPPASELSEMFV